MNDLPQAKLINEFSIFLSSIEANNFCEGFSESEKEQAVQTLITFKNEALLTLNLISKSLNKDMRILEVGSGLCLLSLFLKKKGFDIVACEPIGEGFDFFERLKDRILKGNSDIKLEVISRGIENVDIKRDGVFDFIFSNNVIEHVADVDAAIKSMSSVLADEGTMLHNCPNYIAPYEPHFGLPLLAFAPNITKAVWSKSINEDIGLWNSFNFITYFEVKKIAKNENLSVEFQPHTTFDSFMRLKDNPVFNARHHNTIVGKIFRILSALGLLSSLKLLPKCINTPMVFTLKKND